MADIEQGFKGSFKAQDVEDSQSSKDSIEVGQEHLAGVTPPHESFEGYHRFDPTATWTPKEERKLVFKTDLMLLSWICFMVWPIPMIARTSVETEINRSSFSDSNSTVEIYQTHSQITCSRTWA